MAPKTDEPDPSAGVQSESHGEFEYRSGPPIDSCLHLRSDLTIRETLLSAFIRRRVSLGPFLAPFHKVRIQVDVADTTCLNRPS